VREFQPGKERKLSIGSTIRPAGLISEAAYERGVNLAASAGGIFPLQDAEVLCRCGQGRSVDLHEFLARWRWFEPHDGPGPGKTPGGGIMRRTLFGELCAWVNSGEDNIVLTARAPGRPADILVELPSYFVFLGHAAN